MLLNFRVKQERYVVVMELTRQMQPGSIREVGLLNLVNNLNGLIT